MYKVTNGPGLVTRAKRVEKVAAGTLGVWQPSHRPRAGKYGRFCMLDASQEPSQAVAQASQTKAGRILGWQNDGKAK
jgi:hypothetical protein